MNEKTEDGQKLKLNQHEKEKVEINENETDDENVICEIHFENNQNRVFYPGEIVNGCVNLKLKATKVVAAIYAHVVGQGHCEWETSTSSGKRRHTKTHVNSEFYINKKIYFVGKKTHKRITVQPGDYKYSFDFEIPEECPTALEEYKDGYIRYYVLVVIDEDVENNKQFQESFTILNPLNLNDDVTYSYPISEESEHIYSTYCCCLCCCNEEPVKVSARIPMRGYAPGQDIEITINVDNKANRKMDNFSATIVKKIEFKADNQTRSTTEKIMTSICEGCPEGESCSRKLCITVPPTPRTETSNICKIEYILEVIIDEDCCEGVSAKFEFPITIGTYPIDKSNTQTTGIVVTQQPLSQKECNQEKLSTINEPTLQPLLLEGNMSFQTKTMPSTSSKPQTTLNPPIFQVGASNRPDKQLENAYRPVYPVFPVRRFPLSDVDTTH